MKRNLCILSIIAILGFLPLLAQSAIYKVQATNSLSQPQNLSTGQISPAIAILETGHALSLKYGSRPPYQGPLFAPKQALDEAEAQNVIPYLIACESRDRNVKEVDSNGFYSYGVLQMQSSTATMFNALEQTNYDPMSPTDAVQLATIAIEHGYLYRWSCAKIEKLL